MEPNSANSSRKTMSTEASHSSRIQQSNNNDNAQPLLPSPPVISNLPPGLSPLNLQNPVTNLNIINSAILGGHPPPTLQPTNSTTYIPSNYVFPAGTPQNLQGQLGNNQGNEIQQNNNNNNNNNNMQINNEHHHNNFYNNQSQNLNVNLLNSHLPSHNQPQNFNHQNANHQHFNQHQGYQQPIVHHPGMQPVFGVNHFNENHQNHHNQGHNQNQNQNNNNRHHKKATDQTGCDVEAFLVNTLRKNPRDRLTIYTLEKDMRDFCANPAIYGIRFPKMTSYHRMLVHRIATYFNLDHNVDDTGRQVVCHKGPNTRIPHSNLEDLVKIAEQKDEALKKAGVYNEVSGPAGRQLQQKVGAVGRGMANNNSNNGDNSKKRIESGNRTSTPLSNYGKQNSVGNRTRSTEDASKSELPSPNRSIPNEKTDSKEENKISEQEETPRTRALRKAEERKRSDETKKAINSQIETYHEINARATAEALALPKVYQPSPAYHHFQNVLPHGQVAHHTGPAHHQILAPSVQSNLISNPAIVIPHQPHHQLVGNGQQLSMAAPQPHGLLQPGHLVTPIIPPHLATTPVQNGIYGAPPGLLSTAEPQQQPPQQQQQNIQLPFSSAPNLPVSTAAPGLLGTAPTTSTIPPGFGDNTHTLNEVDDLSMLNSKMQALIASTTTTAPNQFELQQPNNLTPNVDSAIDASIQNSSEISPNACEILPTNMEVVQQQANYLNNMIHNGSNQNQINNQLQMAMLQSQISNLSNASLISAHNSQISCNVTDATSGTGRTNGSVSQISENHSNHGGVNSPKPLSNGSQMDSIEFEEAQTLKAVQSMSDPQQNILQLHQNLVASVAQNQINQPQPDLNQVLIAQAAVVQQQQQQQEQQNAQQVLNNLISQEYLNNYVSQISKQSSVVSNGLPGNTVTNLAVLSNQATALVANHASSPSPNPTSIDQTLIPFNPAMNDAITNKNLNDLHYFEVKFNEEAAKTMKKFEAQIPLNFLRQQYNGTLYWIPRTQRTKNLYLHNKSAGMKASVEDFTIIAALDPRISAQAQNEVSSKNLNFVVSKLQTSDAIAVVSGYEEYRHIFVDGLNANNGNNGISLVNNKNLNLGDYNKTMTNNNNDCTSYNSDSGSANLGVESQLAPGMILSSN